MQWLILASFCIFSCLANEIKNATAKGSYGSYDQPSYSPPSYDQGYGNAPYGPYMAYQYMSPPPPPLVDRDVCDLDASVLLVVHSRRTHRDRHHPPGHPPMNRAHRVRCSVIANYDEDSCNACCQHAARRDKSMPNSAFVGFLAVTDDFEGRRDDSRERDHDFSDEDMGHARVKRSHPHSTKVNYVKLHEQDFAPKPYYKNVKCVCCAPKRSLPPPPRVYPAQPLYGQPVASQPTYQQPVVSPPVYQQPVASPPVYQQPVASPPVYQQPAASQSTYQPVGPPAQAPPTQAPAVEYPTAPTAQAPPQSGYQQAAPPAQNPVPSPY
ncbi:hypothetical protein COOONC_07871 [Cooperia oncophora]